MDNHDNLFHAVQNLRAELSSITKGSHTLRESALTEVRKLLREWETPRETIERICFSNIWETIIFKTATDMGLFQALHDTSEPLSAEELAQACRAETLLTERLLRPLVAFGAVRESEEGKYSASAVGNVFADHKGRATMGFCFGYATPAWQLLPQQLKAENYRSLVSGNDTVFSKAYNAPGKTCWEILGTTEYVDDCGVFMATFGDGHQDWLDFYPVEERLIAEASSRTDDVFMVDIGGCSGSQAAALKRRFPRVPGRFIVEDLPNTIPKENPAGIELIAHDFFEPHPQAVHGARVYYMRYISHDWSQAALVAILKNIKEVMRKGYSKLIIHDWIVPERNVPTFMGIQDLNMMALGGGEERTEKRHREAAALAGLKVTGVWDPKDGISEGIIECEVA